MSVSEDDSIVVELRDAPAGLRCDRVSRDAINAGKLKLRYGNGYEHFKLDHYVTISGTEIPVFVWSDRTRVAE